MYTGWSLNRFSAQQPFAGNGVAFEETGYLMGLRMLHPLPALKAHLVLGAGGVYNQVEVIDKKGDLVGGSSLGLGWQMEAGLLLPFGKKLVASPGIRYRELPGNIHTAGANIPTQLNYVFVAVGLLHNF
jgi:hypothetical protein